MQILFALALVFAVAPRTPLIDAVKNVDHDAVRTLLKQGVNESVADHYASN